MSPELYAKCAPTMFKKGNQPRNHREVGSERVNRDGYIEIKVEEHRVIWEAAHGPIPKGCIVIFRDNDKQNLDISNLVMIKKSINATLNHLGLCEYTGEFKDTAIAIAELKHQTRKKKMDSGRR